ncbi:MAG TPA: zf-HC2 domain-containing protein [Candidatus Acidoferrales bacterium]|nr:zf-HC2 domain-containing protein [Candidatus Acidoferrales bacterium]
MNAEQKGTACPEYEVLLEDHLSGGMDAERAAKIAEHLKACAGCRGALEDATASLGLLRIAEPTPDPGPQFPHLVMARIRAERAEQPSFWQPLVSLSWKFAATAALAFALLFAYDMRAAHQAPSLTAVSMRSATSNDLFGQTEMVQVPANRDEVLMMVSETSTNNDQR